MVPPSKAPSLREPSLQKDLETRKSSLKPVLQKSSARKEKSTPRKPPQKPKIEIHEPPNYDSRKFNVCDIEGDIDYDEKGEAAPGEPDPNDGLLRDKQGRVINNKGYLLDPSNGNIISNNNGEVMFERKDLDDKGEIPAPFSIEKHNFNAHAVLGDFDYDVNGKPKISKGKNGSFADKRVNKVSERGYRID